MPLKSSPFLLVLIGGVMPLWSLAIAPAWADGAPAGQFGAPVLPVAGFGLPVKPDGTVSAAAQPAGPAKSWTLERAKPQGSSTGADVTAASDGPNLNALRFYAQQNDLARVAAEIRLLRAKFPGWEPPADLFTEVRTGESEQPLWDLFAKHDLAGLHAAIDDRRQKTPGWQPSSDLSTKLALAEAFDALTRASDDKDFATVVDIATTNNGLMTCATIDAIWRTAEALILTNDEDHGVEAYRFILANCPNPKERLATAQKAMILVKSPASMDSLLRMGRRLPDGTSEFADLRLDGVRQRIGDATRGKAVAPPSEADLAELTARAHGPNGSKDAELLGWSALGHKDFASATSWFRAALQAGPSAKAAEGLVLALRDGGQLPEALKLAPQYAALGPLNRKLMMEVVVSSLADAKGPPAADALASLGAAIDAEKSADAAQSLGWSLFKGGDVPRAQDWFRKSIDWQPNEAAAVGLMLAARRLKHGADYTTVVSTYKDRFARVAELDKVMRVAAAPVRPVRQARHGSSHARRPAGDGGWDRGASEIVQTFESGHVDQALAMMDARRGQRAEPRGLAVVRGWALYKKGDYEGAKQVFNEVGHRGMTDEATKGLQQIERAYSRPTAY